MTSYKITTSMRDNMIYVVQTFEHGHTTHQDVMHGPYKNEESAKRRIRDLKRKDNEQTEIVADMQATGMMPNAPVVELEKGNENNIKKLDADRRNDMARDDQQPIMRDAEKNPDGFKPISGINNAEKLAMSSEYGKSKQVVASLAKSIVHQVGCYPAVSKHSYQR